MKKIHQFLSTLSKGLIVLLCSEVVRQRVPDHGAVHSECSESDSG